MGTKTNGAPGECAELPHETGRWFRTAWTLIQSVPTRYGAPPRVRILRLAGASVGVGVTVGPRVKILGPAGLRIADRVGVARDSLLDARAGIRLHEGAMVGFEAILLTWTHRFDQADVFVAEQGFRGKELEIGAGAWIGARAIVLPGAHVGEAAVVGAGSVVTRPVPPGMIVAGNPAREVRQR